MHTFLGKEKFEARYGNLFRAIFCGSDARRSSFRSEEWSFALTSREWLRDALAFAALCRAVKSFGDEEIVFTDIQIVPNHRWAVATSCDYEAYLAAMRAEEVDVLPAMRSAVFSASGKWGAIVDTDFTFISGYTIFGGDRSFIEGWASFYGGVEKMRANFRKYIDDARPYPWPQLPIDAKVALLSDAGW